MTDESIHVERLAEGIAAAFVLGIIAVVLAILYLAVKHIVIPYASTFKTFGLGLAGLLVLVYGLGYIVVKIDEGA